MRFLKSFLIVMAVALFISALAVVVYVDGALHVAARQVRRDMNRTYLLTRDPKHGKSCFERTLDDELDIEVGRVKPGVIGYQLRFENETDYVVEVVCANGNAETVNGLGGRLPYGVTKVSGSGVMVPLSAARPLDLEARVLLGKNFRLLETGYTEGVLKWGYKTDDNWIDYGVDSAQTTCEGWGYQCCSESLEVGRGEKMQKTLNCDEYCYQNCKQKPYVLYFNTTPLMDRKSRWVEVYEGQAEIGFGFEVADEDGKVDEVWIDYGDGDREASRPVGLVNHTYECGVGVCVFQVGLEAVDDDGLELVETRLNNLEVVVRD